MCSLMELLLCVSPFSTRAFDGVSKVSKELMMPVPSIDLVRVVTKVPRGKCHGPDGVWPYSIYKLPDVCLRAIHRVFEYVCDMGG